MANKALQLRKTEQKNALPTGKIVITDKTQRMQALDHCIKQLRDGQTFFIGAHLNVAVGIYNIAQFQLWTEYDLVNLEELLNYKNVGISKRHANRMREIGEAFAEAIGHSGEFIDQRMIDEVMGRDVFQSRLGYRQLHLLSRTSSGMHDLVAAKSKPELDALVRDLADGARELRAEKDAKPRSPKKLAVARRYTETAPPTFKEVNVLLDTVTRALTAINREPLAKLVEAIDALVHAQSYLGDKGTSNKKAGSMWGQVHVLLTRLESVEKILPDSTQRVAQLKKTMFGDGGIAEISASFSIEDATRLTDDDMPPDYPGRQIKL